MINHQTMNNLCKDIDFHQLLCVPMVKAKVASGFNGRLQATFRSKEIDLLGENPLSSGVAAISGLIKDLNDALTECKPTALCSAEITWRAKDNDPFTSKGHFFAWLMTEPMEEKSRSKFKPVSLTESTS